MHNLIMFSSILSVNFIYNFSFFLMYWNIYFLKLKIKYVSISGKLTFFKK